MHTLIAKENTSEGVAQTGTNGSSDLKPSTARSDVEGGRNSWNNESFRSPAEAEQKAGVKESDLLNRSSPSADLFPISEKSNGFFEQKEKKAQQPFGTYSHFGYAQIHPYSDDKPSRMEGFLFACAFEEFVELLFHLKKLNIHRLQVF